ncbi:hypothetical protein ISN45_At05g049880 [Arabidopsis thaliana x Arabidopsis arenosa]|uniref:Uncharacterized protein n=2 Tax=Arabidopsis TaxID=3701 RepID=A0A8T2DN90_ARASU|nr:hypothetical protein ISN45_At05g049880 [Arabidopsis thaliana x Arabidopsis arenosa]KAG7612947.1 hypothetical protein ISN44_As05g049170 [Arabidopsis suecica]
MSSFKLLVAFSLVVIVAISYDLFCEKKINAKTQTCFDHCNETCESKESRNCNKRCLEIAFTGGTWLVILNNMNFLTNLLFIVLVVVNIMYKDYSFSGRMI